MPGLAELTYTTLGGIIGAAASGYFTRHHERRQLRAAVMERVHALAAITAGVRDIEPGWAPVSRTADGRARLTTELGIRATLDDGADAEPAQQAARARLTQPQHTELLFRHLDPAGERWETWQITPEE